MHHSTCRRHLGLEHLERRLLPGGIMAAALEAALADETLSLRAEASFVSSLASQHRGQAFDVTSRDVPAIKRAASKLFGEALDVVAKPDGQRSVRAPYLTRQSLTPSALTPDLSAELLADLRSARGGDGAKSSSPAPALIYAYAHGAQAPVTTPTDNARTRANFAGLGMRAAAQDDSGNFTFWNSRSRRHDDSDDARPHRGQHKDRPQKHPRPDREPQSGGGEPMPGLLSDVPEVFVQSTGPNAYEANLEAGEFTFSRPGYTAGDLVVYFSIAGTATEGGDYQTLPRQITIPDGADHIEMSVVPINDAAGPEGLESVQLTLTSHVTYVRGTTGPTSVTVLDDEEVGLPLPPTVTIHATVATAYEEPAQNGAFRVSRTGGVSAALNVSIAMSGAATENVDYQDVPSYVTIPAGLPYVTFYVQPNIDGVWEGPESVQSTILGSAFYSIGVPGNAALTLRDAPAGSKSKVSITATEGKTQVKETPGVGDNPAAQFTVKREGGDQSGPLTVEYTVYAPVGPGVRGYATPDKDYIALSGSVAIEAGASTALIDVTPINDNIKEYPEKVRLFLKPDDDYELKSPAQAQVTIIDDSTDAGTVVTVFATAPVTYESGRPWGRFTIYREVPQSTPLAVMFTLAGTATEGTHYRLTTEAHTAIIPADQIGIHVYVQPIFEDAVAEPNRTVIMTITDAMTYDPGDPDDATVTIYDNDTEVSITATDPTATEAGETTAAFEVTRDGATDEDLLVYYSVAGSAAAGRPDDANRDYDALPGLVRIPAGETRATFNVKPHDDALPEFLETVVIYLRPASHYRLHEDLHFAYATIEDNDGGITDTLGGNLTAYRPWTRALPWRQVPEATEHSTGAGIRRNLDDDDGDGVLDHLDTNETTAFDDDLVAMTVNLNRTKAALATSETDVFLRRSDSHVKLYLDSEKESPLEFNGNDATINDYLVDVGSQSALVVYVEWTDTGADASSVIQLMASADGGAALDLDTGGVRFYPFNSIVIGFVGESQSPFDSETGMHQMVMQLYEQGYDARIFDEDDVGTDFVPTGLNPLSWAGEDRAFESLLNASLRGVNHVAILGYSRGGGATHDLSQAIFSSWPEAVEGVDIDALDLGFTAYIDGVRKRDDSAETRLPPGTDYHFNIYQRAWDPLPRLDDDDFFADLFAGDSVDDADDGVTVVNEDVQAEGSGSLVFDPDSQHSNGNGRGIAENEDVQEEVTKALTENFVMK